MYQTLLRLWLFSLLLAPSSLAAQRYGEWDRACDTGYGPRFSAPFTHGVIFGEKEFLTEWRSEATARPLPSKNWYVATPNRDPVSSDNTKQWHNAGVLVHCWVERTPYYVSLMAAPIDYRGSLQDNCKRGAGGTWDVAPAPEDGSSGPYNPYDAWYEEECNGTTGETQSGSGTAYNTGDFTGGETVTWSGGVGDGGRSVCGSLAVVEYVCIDVWDEERGWVEWDCGYATTC
jgi:hypothetical protein